MTPPLKLRRERPWWRSRRLLGAVALLDVIGAVVLVLALSHRAGGQHRSPAAVATATVTIHRPATTRVARVTPAHLRAHRPPTSHAPRPHHRHTMRPAVAGLPVGAPAGFARLATTEPGAIGLAVAPLGAGAIHSLGALQVDDAWSTMKVPVLTTVLRDAESAGRPISAAATRDATLALEQSDNDAVNALFASLEASDGGLDGASNALQRTLNAAGDDATHVNTVPNDQGFSTFGQTQWSARGEVAFYRGLARGCLLSAHDTGWVLGLMSHVEADQRWGAGTARYPAGTPLMFKGGWGPEQGGDYLVRQSAIVGAGDRGWVFSMLARPSDGAFGTGTAMLSRMAAWVARTFPASRAAPSRACR